MSSNDISRRSAALQKERAGRQLQVLAIVPIPSGPGGETRMSAMKARLRLLFIADADATNASVWLAYFANELGNEVHFYAMKPLRRPIGAVTIHDLGTTSRAADMA